MKRTTSAGYVDGYVLPVPRKKLQAYRRLALTAGRVWRKHGALAYFECAGDDLKPHCAGIRFPQTVKAKPGETVVFAFIVFQSRKHRDRVNAKVMKDPLLSACADKPMPFDAKRMAYGGFRTLVSA